MTLGHTSLASPSILLSTIFTLPSDPPVTEQCFRQLSSTSGIDQGCWQILHCCCGHFKAPLESEKVEKTLRERLHFPAQRVLAPAGPNRVWLSQGLTPATVSKQNTIILCPGLYGVFLQAVGSCKVDNLQKVSGIRQKACSWGMLTEVFFYFIKWTLIFTPLCLFPFSRAWILTLIPCPC